MYFANSYVISLHRAILSLYCLATSKNSIKTTKSISFMPS